MSSQDSEQDEREQIQDDIERLQLALQEEDDYEDTDDENVLHIDQDYVPDYDDGTDPKPGPSGISTYEQAEEEDGEADIQLGTADLAQMMGEDGEIVINPETCLALNRAYQEILLDLLRKIEISLQENRSKQTTLEEELTAKSSRRNQCSSDPHSAIKPLTWFRVPFFRDANGRHAPQNEDVQLKKTLGEIRQDHLFPILWYQADKDTLTEAVKREAQEKLIRPLMNKKEVEAEKHLLADKNKKLKVKKEIESTLSDIDTQIEVIRCYSLEELLNHLDTDDIDWMKISNIDFLGKHGSEDCKKFWVNVLQPRVNKDKWVPEERDLLQELAIKHEMRNWDIIAQELGTGRSAYQCLQYYQQNLNVNFSSREWTEEEDSLLKEVVENCRVANRISWNQVCYFIEGRNWKQCHRRWVQIDPTTKRGRWSAEEDCLLLSAVHLHGNDNWKLIREMVPGRSAYQCRDRYNNCLNPKLKPPASWSYEEDKRLLQLANKYSIGDGTCISWTKVAAEMPGRTDNMVLARYKRLKSWKIRSDWLNTQNDETRNYLGAIFNKDVDGQGSQMPVEIPNLGTFASGVQRDDYLKQRRDKEAGDIVVPRPPLSCKFVTRNMEQLWQRKLQLKRLVEHHLQKSMSKSVTSQDKMLIPSKTAKEFVPFGKLNKKQQIEMDGLFKDKDPYSVKVSDMLAITNKYKDNNDTALQKRVRRCGKDHRIDSKMADIIQMKNYMSMVTRTGAGRPKKFYIFHPNGKPPTKEVPENIAQLTSVSTTLMLSALEVNGHKALENAQRKPENKMSQPEKDNFIMLKKLFPPLPAFMRAQLEANSQSITIQGQKVISSGVSHPGSVTNGQSAPDAGTMAVNTLQGLTVSVTNKDYHSSSGNGESGSKKYVSILKPTTTQRTVSQTSIQASTAVTRSETPLIIRNPPISSPPFTALRAAAHSTSPLGKQTVLGQTQSSASSVSVSPERPIVKTVFRIDPQTQSHTVSEPVSSQSASSVSSISEPVSSQSASSVSSISEPVSSQSASSVSSISEPVSSQSASSVSSIASPGATAQPPRVVVVQKKGTPNPSNIPLLPPGVKNMEAFAGLLVQRQLLTASAGSLYNEKYYANVAKQMRSSLITSKNKEEGKDEILVKTVLDSYKNSSSAAVMRGAKHINKNTFKKENTETTSLRDSLSDVRITPEYQLLQKRFEGLFSWPALLSTVQTGDHVHKPEVSGLITGKKARMTQRKKILQSKPAPPELDVDMGDLLAAGETSFAAKVKIALVKQEKKKKRYPCSNGRFFYRNMLLDKEHRQQMNRRRMVGKRINKELRDQGVSLNDLNTKSKPLKKRVHPTRQSARIAKKMDVVMPEPQPVLIPEPQVHKRKLDMNVQVKVERLDQTKDDQVVPGQGLMTDRIQSVIRTGQNQGQISNPYLSEHEDVVQDQSPNTSEHESGVQDQSINRTVVRKQKPVPIVTSKPGVDVNDSNITSGDDRHVSQGDVTPLDLDNSSQEIYDTNKTSRISTDSQGPSVAKKRRTEATEHSENSNGGDSIYLSCTEDEVTECVTPLQSNSTTILQGAETQVSMTPGPAKSSSTSTPRGPALQLSTTTGPFSVFPGMGTPSPRKSDPVPVQSSTGVAIGRLAPTATGSPSGMAMPFTHPGFEGHVLVAIPVDQLAHSSTQTTPGYPNVEGVFPVTLLINANTLPMSSPVRTSHNAGTNQIPVNHEADSISVNQTAESVTVSQTIAKDAANETAESLASNQTTESVALSHTMDTDSQ